MISVDGSLQFTVTERCSVEFLIVGSRIRVFVMCAFKKYVCLSQDSHGYKIVKVISWHGWTNLKFQLRAWESLLYLNCIVNMVHSRGLGRRLGGH